MLKNENFVYGIRPLAQALDSGKTLDKVFIQNGLKGENIQFLKQKLKENDIYINYVPLEKLNRLTKKNHQGVCAFISPIEFGSVEQIVESLYEQGKEPFILILDRITDTRNFGSICRTAEILKVDAIVIAEKGAASITADAIKASSGAIFNIKICKEKNLTKTVEFLKMYGIQIVCATEKTNDIVYDYKLKMPLALIVGNEETGISLEILKTSDAQLKLPMFGQTGSLNVSVATSCFLYEIVRQNFTKFNIKIKQ